MFIPSVITMLCVGGVTFYLRFLLALCKEWKPRRRRAHTELRRSQKMPKVVRQLWISRPSIAIPEVSEIRLNTSSQEF